jgi:hypothetical protein
MLLPQGEVLQHQFVVSAKGYRHSAADEEEQSDHVMIVVGTC